MLTFGVQNESDCSLTDFGESLFVLAIRFQVSSFSGLREIRGGSLGPMSGLGATRIFSSLAISRRDDKSSMS